MKKPQVIALIVFLGLVFGTTTVFQSCENSRLKELLNSRIKSVETTTIGATYQIISVDGKEFIVSSSGGIYPLQ